MLWLFATFFFLFHIVVYYVNGLTLTSGQRIASRCDINTNNNKNGNNNREGGHLMNSFWNLPAVEKWADDYHLKEIHLKHLYRFLKQNPIQLHDDDDDDSWKAKGLTSHDLINKVGFPKQAAIQILNDFTINQASIIQVHPSQQGAGTKFVIQFETASGKIQVETVLIQHDGKKQQRNTICVSSQVGCAKKCTFCATGTMGLQANLNSAQILEQVYLVQQYYNQQNNNNNSRWNIVFMGMGEPLDNYNAVHESTRGLTHQCLFGLNAKQITISTVGASISKLQLLADEIPQISLALSLHSALSSTRQLLIPSSSSLEDLGNALDYYSQQRQQKVKHTSKYTYSIMLEYLLIYGINDDTQHIDALVQFCQQLRSKVFVNIIPYNPTIAGDLFDYTTPSNESIQQFYSQLKSNNIPCHIRWSSANGRDTNAACGQLLLSTTNKKS